MSAPTPATGDGSPAAGFYPDPSIPGYVRYWNGAAWVPGTSRPAPRDGESLPAPPSAVSAYPTAPHTPSVEETGPVFLDEDPETTAGSGHGPASAWHADTSQQSGFGGDRDHRVSWGSTPQDPRAGGAGADGLAASAGLPSAPAPAESWGAATGRDARSPGAPAAAGSGADPRAASGVRFDRAPGPSADGDDGAGGAAPADPTGGALPGVRSVGGPDPVPEGRATSRAQQPTGSTAPAEGTMTIRPPDPQQPLAPQPSESLQQARPQAQYMQPQAPPAQPQVPAQQQTPLSAGVGGGAASWAQQVHQLAQVQAQAEAERRPVVPWKPPVDDPFLQAAQAQAAARPASLGKRFAARLIDTLVLGAVAGAVSFPFISTALTHIDEKIEAAKLSGETVTVWLLDGTTATQFGIALAVLLLLGVLYEALPTSRWGHTLGKKLMGLEVRDIESFEPPAFGAALRRWLVHGVLGVLVIGVVNVLWCLFDRPWRQCWHDKVAHTFVAG
ncbi:RDD family protein [Streptomyces sp. NPDC057445]|uniref:RDD family protein n=1 Tax=Streptomyces sp. NPDC057445 TaxID=3346136 RepID=UPI00367F32C5